MPRLLTGFNIFGGGAVVSGLRTAAWMSPEAVASFAPTPERADNARKGAVVLRGRRVAPLRRAWTRAWGGF